MKENNMGLGIDEVIQLAIQNTDEGWAMIDTVLALVADEETYFDWAKSNLGNSESGLRDLSASILERTSMELNEEILTGLLLLMREQNDENPYPSFRAACALVKRRQDGFVLQHLPEIQTKLQIFTDDPDVSEIAQSYLSLT